MLDAAKGKGRPCDRVELMPVDPPPRSGAWEADARRRDRRGDLRRGHQASQILTAEGGSRARPARGVSASRRSVRRRSGEGHETGSRDTRGRPDPNCSYQYRQMLRRSRRRRHRCDHPSEHAGLGNLGPRRRKCERRRGSSRTRVTQSATRTRVAAALAAVRGRRGDLGAGSGRARAGGRRGTSHPLAEQRCSTRSLEDQPPWRRPLARQAHRGRREQGRCALRLALSRDVTPGRKQFRRR